MALGNKAPYPFLALGIAFVVIGVINRGAFLYVGLAFLFVAAVFMLRARKG